VRAPLARTRRPRLTGRAGILALVLAVLVVSYASSARAYLAQRHSIDRLDQEIAQRQTAIARLQSQVARWKDPAYVALQARERFGYELPGETSYVALDRSGHKIQAPAELGRPVAVTRPTEAWWGTVWGSVQLAGNPTEKTTRK
jgi:cell division protein FtsB